MEKSTLNYKHAGRWSIQAIRSKADSLDNFRSKVVFLKSVIRFIEENKPKGRVSLSANANITIKKIQQYLQIITEENKRKKEVTDDDRFNWTGDEDTLINLFFKLKNNTLGKGNRPLIDESNRRIAEFLRTHFNIGLSIETIFDKLNPSKDHLRSNKEKSIAIDIVIMRRNMKS